MFPQYIWDFMYLLTIGSQVEEVLNSMPEKTPSARNFNYNNMPSGSNIVGCVDMQELCALETFPRRATLRMFDPINVLWSKLFLNLQ